MSDAVRSFLTALCCMLQTAAAVAQDTTPVFRTTSELVLLDVQVLHKQTNTATADLGRADLLVLEDGQPQAIAFFSRDELPLSIVMLFDMTDTSQAVLKRLAEGAQSASKLAFNPRIAASFSFKIWRLGDIHSARSECSQVKLDIR